MMKRAHSPDTDSDSSAVRRNGGMSGAGGNAASGTGSALMSSARTLAEVARRCSIIWQGSLILKSSLFPSKFYLIDGGDPDIVDSLMRDEEGKHNLRITQRLRLDPPKLEDVQKRINTSSSHAIFLGLAGTNTIVNSPSSSILTGGNGNSSAMDDTSGVGGVQTRPLRNLVSYLKQKEAAGVISLLNKETEATGVLYAFPPCEFSMELLRRTCTSITDESLKEDHLVVVVVRGGAA